MPADDLRLQPKIYTEIELITLIRVIPIDAAVSLLKSYGASERAAGRLDQAVEYRDRLAVGMEANPHA